MYKFKSMVSGALLSGLLAVSATSFQSHGSVLIQNWEGSGESGFGDLAMNKNDDGSSQEISFDGFAQLGFDTGVNFFGETHDSFFINNNGNITFDGPVSSFTPNTFPASSNPMIAPFWGDVDTRCDSCGNVYFGSPNSDTLVVTWDSVGFFSQNSSLTNTFQLVMIDRSDTGAGNFDVEFRYDDINWTTGGASGGSGGLGGTPAQAGYDAGDGTNFFIVPGSQTADVVDLDIAPSNTDTAGIWKFAIRDGQLPGDSADNPLLPVIDPNNPGDYSFEFAIEDPSEPFFIDPDVAIGYDYIVNSGPSVTAVLLPDDIGDGIYDLWLWDALSSAWVDSGDDITGGDWYNFGSAVDRFRIMGIETDAMVDPLSPIAFITGLQFDSAGIVDMNQRAITTFVPDSNVSVPEPQTILLFLLSSLLFMRARKVKA